MAHRATVAQVPMLAPPSSCVAWNAVYCLFSYLRNGAWWPGKAVPGSQQCLAHVKVWCCAHRPEHLPRRVPSPPSHVAVCDSGHTPESWPPCSLHPLALYLALCYLGRDLPGCAKLLLCGSEPLSLQVWKPTPLTSFSCLTTCHLLRGTFLDHSFNWPPHHCSFLLCFTQCLWTASSTQCQLQKGRDLALFPTYLSSQNSSCTQRAHSMCWLN